METNRDVEAAWEYHEGTKHSFQSVHSSQHFLDFENKPLPFKIYTGLEPISLPQGLEPSGVPALEALAASAAEPEGDRLPDLKLLARLLHYAAGITKRMRYSQGEMLFRAASCTGALYHIDLYLVCGDLPDLEAGVYHFGVHDFALRQLRRGDFRGELVRAAAGESAVALARAVARADNIVLLQKMELEYLQAGKVRLETLSKPLPTIANAAIGMGPFPLPKVPARVDQFWSFMSSLDSAPTLPALAKIWRVTR